MLFFLEVKVSDCTASSCQFEWVQHFAPFHFSKSKMIREREEQRAREEEAVAQAQAPEEEATWQPPTDEVLRGYIEDVRNTIQPLVNTKEQVTALARYHFIVVNGNPTGKIMR